MKVFISWSGEKARDFALELKSWLPYVIQELDPWVSEVDIDSGTMSMESIHDQLNNTRYGVICTTAENQNKSWINYEAGAIWKSLGGQTNVVPLLIDVERNALTSPLKNFQSRILTRPENRREEMWKLVLSISKALPRPIDEPRLVEFFDAQWHKMESIISQIENNNYAYKAQMSPTDRSLQDIHQELLKMREAQRGADEEIIDALNELLTHRKEDSFFPPSFSQTRHQRFERLINESLIARGSADRAHVVRIDKRNYDVFSSQKIPDEIKRILHQDVSAIPYDVDFRFFIGVPDESPLGDVI